MNKYTYISEGATFKDKESPHYKIDQSCHYGFKCSYLHFFLFF